MEQLEEGQIVLCTVDKIVGTTVFVKIQDNEEGTITTSEIAPGRIRNLRAYVVPEKKIVCKILSIRNGRVQLSLRRVKQNEKKELLDKIKKEKNYNAILKTVLGKEKADKIIEKIVQEQSIFDFFEEIKEQQKNLEKLISKKEAERIIQILESKKEKPKEIKQIFKLSNKSSEGIKIIKEIINNVCKNSKGEISYIAAGRYRLSMIGENFKELKSEINRIINEIETEAKKQKCEFSVEKN
jgi:translation initiation factor 2 alpha subunit (eIF-2alpha)